MANVGRTSSSRPGETTLSQNPLVQAFVPSSGWTEDPNGYYLLVDLPEFKKEEVKLQLDTSGHVIVSGERLTRDNKKIMRFEQVFTVPPNSDSNKISGKFDGEILYVTVPKRALEERKEPEILNENVNGVVAKEESSEEETLHSHESFNNRDNEKQGDDSDNEQKSEKKSAVDSFGEDFIRKWGNEPSNFERAMKILKRNRDVIITAMLAFSLGVLVSRKFGSAGREGPV